VRLAQQLIDATALITEIERCINDQAEVTDAASPKLANIRREMLVAHDRLRSKLERIIASPRARQYLQEPLITQREGRYVIPLKTDFKGRIPGLIHDTSASGATLFVEPLAVVELGNRIRELQLDEQKEIERILRELSSQVAARGDEIRQTVELLAQIDLALAKARYSYAIKAVEPELHASHVGALNVGTLERHPPNVARSNPQRVAQFLRFVAARHPLLDPATVVPITVYAGQEFRILVITGPNTGGKTVALKTTGLLTLMAQAGLHIPAQEGSQLTVFSGVYADIGDEQSIEQSLSTFSSHLTHIIDLLRAADNQSLVLLDEIGAGTDPVEGSALARAILSYLLERNITTLATTHYSELKAFAHTTPGVANASVEFDVETLSPTYELTIGLPGRSNAFAIAERLGLSRLILEQAKQWLTESDVAMEDMLAEIKRAREETLAVRQSAQVSEETARRAERELQKRLAQVEAERREILNEARRQAQAELAALRDEIARLRRELARVPRASETFAQVTEQAEALEELAEPLPPAPQPVLTPERPVQVGDRVWVTSLNVAGEVIGLPDDGQADVQMGILRAKVPLAELELQTTDDQRRTSISEPTMDIDRGSSIVVHRAPAAASVELRLELSLRGLRAEEAIERLEKYLDDAYLAGLPKVRIIHGKGTGVLRRVVREVLSSHPLVATYREGDRYEGGDGVTVAELRKLDVGN
jgi:DNA mismatch repair protein MutS2